MLFPGMLGGTCAADSLLAEGLARTRSAHDFGIVLFGAEAGESVCASGTSRIVDSFIGACSPVCISRSGCREFGLVGLVGSGMFGIAGIITADGFGLCDGFEEAAGCVREGAGAVAEEGVVG